MLENVIAIWGDLSEILGVSGLDRGWEISLIGWV